MLSTIDNLQVKEKIGTGAYGFVHRAESTEGNHYALKVIMQSDVSTEQEALQMAEKEYSIHSVLEHENIVKCLRKS